jgi:hypothetical protein
MRKYSLLIISSIVFISLGCLYLYCSPLTVQSGDTGELVTNSYFLRVSHPPGYPLWTLLYHIPTKYLNFGNPFAAASILTSILGLISFYILFFSFPSIASLLVISVTGTSAIIWRYFLLPDVFALHSLFLCIIFFIFMKPKLLNRWWYLFLISLSVAHHHTIVFAFPIFAFALMKSELTKKKIILSILFGLFSLSTYFALLAFHPNDYGSWGELNSFDSLVNHFLRKEYGTFSLAEESLNSTSWFMFFLKHILFDFWALILILSYFFLRNFNEFKSSIKTVFVFIFCTISYLLVFNSLARVSLDVTGESTFERFLITPLFFFVFISLFILKDQWNRFKSWMAILLILNTGVNFWRNFDQVNYKDKTGIHDLILNSFRDLPAKSVFFAHGDTFGFASYYLHDVLRFRNDIYLIHTGWEFPWSSKKAKNKFPEIFNGKGTNFILGAVDLKKFKLYSNTFPPIMPEHLRLYNEGVVYRYDLKENDKNVIHQCKQQYFWIKRPNISHFHRFEENAYFDQAYGSCHFDLGLNYLKNGKFELANFAFEISAKLSPFSAKYQERLCFVLNKLRSTKLDECERRLNFLLMETSPQYYLNKYDL